MRMHINALQQSSAFQAMRMQVFIDQPGGHRGLLQMLAVNAVHPCCVQAHEQVMLHLPIQWQVYDTQSLHACT